MVNANRSLEGRSIALVTPLVVRGNGQGRVNYEIVRKAVARGARVTVLANRVAPELLEAGVRAVSFPGANLPTHLARSQAFIAQSHLWLARRRSTFDVVHANGSVTLFPSDVNTSHFVHAAWAKSPAHTSRYHRNAYGLYHGLLTRVHVAEELVAYRASRNVVAVSRQVAGELIAAGVDAHRVRTILNGVDTDEFAPGEESREALGLPTGFLALFAGDMSTPRKNLDTVLAAMRELPNVTLAVLGSIERNPYPAMVAEMGLADRVRFLGFRRDVGAVMRAADAFVFPSRYEACSLVILEALASGLPVVTARTAGGSEIVGAESGEVIDDPDDVPALVRAIARIAASPDTLATMSRAARAVALDNTWDVMSDRYADLYASVASERESRLR